MACIIHIEYVPEDIVYTKGVASHHYSKYHMYMLQKREWMYCNCIMTTDLQKYDIDHLI